MAGLNFWFPIAYVQHSENRKILGQALETVDLLNIHTMVIRGPNGNSCIYLTTNQVYRS